MGAGSSKSTQEPMTGSAVLSASTSSAASSSSSSSHPPLPLSSHLKYPAPLPAGCTILDHDKNRTPIASRPEELFSVLTAAEKQLIERCFEGLDPDNLVDIHTHIVGIGTNGSGCYINEKLNSPIGHPIIWIKKKFFLTACSVRDSDPDADLKVAEVIANLKRSTTNQLGGRHGKCHIFAFDQVYNEQGEPQKADSGFHVPNQWVFQLCQAFPDVFVPVASIHPYRKDAIDALHDAYQQGARMIKWLPNAQSINPSHPICKPFYLAMRSLGMVLLTHTGVEHSVDFAYHNDELGNPLLLRAPLDAGVKVIAAHCASEGCAGLCWHDIKQIQQLTKQEKEGEEDDHHHHEHDHDHEAGEACESKDDSIDGDDDDNGGSSSRPTKRTKLDVPPPTGTSTAPSTSIFSILFGSEPGVNLPTQPVISTLSQEEKQSASSAAIDADGNRKRKYRFERDEKEEDSEEELCGPAVHKSKVVKKVENFDLFIQLMDCKKYEGLLFGDISSVTAHKRTSVLQTLLNRQDLHHRLINGTDYPSAQHIAVDVPAVSIVIWSSQLRRMKLITPMEEKTLDKIFQYNPLLFDLLLKRCLRSREGRGFLDCVFHTPDFLKQAFETSQYSLTSNNKGQWTTKEAKRVSESSDDSSQSDSCSGNMSDESMSESNSDSDSENSATSSSSDESVKSSRVKKTLDDEDDDMSAGSSEDEHIETIRRRKKKADDSDSDQSEKGDSNDDSDDGDDGDEGNVEIGDNRDCRSKFESIKSRLRAIPFTSSSESSDSSSPSSASSSLSSSSSSCRSSSDSSQSIDGSDSSSSSSSSH